MLYTRRQAPALCNKCNYLRMLLKASSISRISFGLKEKVLNPGAFVYFRGGVREGHGRATIPVCFMVYEKLHQDRNKIKLS